jgi:hypothetical protein
MNHHTWFVCGGRVSLTFFPGWSLQDPKIFASQVAVMTGMPHHTQPLQQKYLLKMKRKIKTFHTYKCCTNFTLQELLKKPIYGGAHL